MLRVGHDKRLASRREPATCNRCGQQTCAAPAHALTSSLIQIGEWRIYSRRSKNLVMQAKRDLRGAPVRPSGGMSSAAKIIIDPKSPVDCGIADYSAGGACIEIRGETRLPNRFELVFGRSGKRCRIV
jgi:hypothetical protein